MKKRVQWGTWLGFFITFLVLGPTFVSPSAMAVSKGLGATGDSCTIDLPDGLKEPGTIDANGKCCSVLHTGKCYDIPKPGTSKAGLATKGVKSAVISAPTATPTPLKKAQPAGKTKTGATPTPTPIPK